MGETGSDTGTVDESIGSVAGCRFDDSTSTQFINQRDFDSQMPSIGAAHKGGGGGGGRHNRRRHTFLRSSSTCTGHGHRHISGARRINIIRAYSINNKQPSAKSNELVGSRHAPSI